MINEKWLELTQVCPFIDAFPECGDGWFDIISKLSRDLKSLGFTGRVVQIKEKFGGLRYYVSEASLEVYNRIDEAEKASYSTCELCGSPGKLTRPDGFWYQTLCKKCLTRLKNTQGKK